MSLQAELSLRMGTLAVDAELAATTGVVVGLLGPNAAGKTTVLRALAGLSPLGRGRVVLDGEVARRHRRRHTDASRPAPHRRRVSGLSALPSPVGARQRRLRAAFPRHVSPSVAGAVGGVALPARHGRPVERSTESPVGRTGAAGGAGARAGDRSPVAAARRTAGRARRRSARRAAPRAAPPPRLVCRKLSACDARPAGGHDPGRPARHPGRRSRRRRPARPTRSGLIHVRATSQSSSGSTSFADGPPTARSRWPTGTCSSAADDSTYSGEVFAVVHPRTVALYRERPDGSPRNVWPGTVEALDVAGDLVRVQIAGPVPLVAEVTPAAVVELRLDDGGPVWAAVKAVEVLVYPA